MKLKSLNVEQNNLYGMYMHNMYMLHLCCEYYYRVILNFLVIDLPGFLHCVRGCYDLTELSTAGNPIEEEPKYRYMGVATTPTVSHICNSLGEWC